MTQQAKDALDKVIEEAREENQAKLPPEDRMADTEMCLAKHDGWSCTKQKDHSGDHVAHGSFGYILSRWN